jgi:hypothetical protein
MITTRELWERVESRQGEVFRQIRGREFTYAVSQTGLRPSTTDWLIPRGHLDKALELVPLKNTVAVQHLYGPSYIYAVLTDPRIRGSDWRIPSRIGRPCWLARDGKSCKSRPRRAHVSTPNSAVCPSN